MRQRVEDLGRIAAMTHTLTSHELFDDRPCRNKDFVSWFEEQTEEFREEWLHNTVYRIKDVEEKLYEIWEIATGQDYLNEPTEKLDFKAMK